MKLAGLMSVWNEEPFAEYTLKQASKMCDVVFVVEGGHSLQFPERSEDGTRDIVKRCAETLGNVHFLEVPFSRQGCEMTSERYDHYQCAVWRWMMNQVHKETKCDWFRFWDADMFFNDADVERIIHTMTVTTANCLSFDEYRFIYNFRYCTIGETGYFYRVLPGQYITPISTLHYGDSELMKNLSFKIEDVRCFHYTGVRTPDRMHQRFMQSMEKGTPGARENWRMWRDLEFTDDDSFLKAFAPIHTRILGGKEPQVYDGKHPEILEGHAWSEAKDVRKA